MAIGGTVPDMGRSRFENGFLPVAHRGSRELWPENTMVSFQGAVSLGYQWLETDLRLTSDGVIVCHHDSTVDRTTDGSGMVRDMSFRQVSELDAGCRFFSRSGVGSERARIPALREVLESFPQTNLIVDLKEDEVVEPLARIIREMEIARRLIVGSFSSRRLRRFRSLSPGVATSAGMAEVSRMLAQGFRNAGRMSCDLVQIPRRYLGIRIVSVGTVRRCHEAGLSVHVWTVNERVGMERLIEIGVDGIITDRPDVLKDVLVARGMW